MICPDILRSAITPAMAMLPAAMDSAQARVMLLAIGLQESRLTARCQIVNGGGKGPARGLWQFERGGGCAGIVRHEASRFWTAEVCKARGVEFSAAGIWAALETDDILAAACARLLLFTDAKALPAIGDEQGAWALYAYRCWRPGKPHPETWPANYAAAVDAVNAAKDN